MKQYLLIGILCFAIACKNDDSKEPVTPLPDAPKSMSYSIITSYPHDTSSYTQGLVIYNGEMYEGTGNYTFSKLKKVDIKTGKALQQISLPDKYFGEGITILNDTIYQLTWKEKKVFVYTLKDFKKVKEFDVDIEGWGLTNDGKNLIVSTGGTKENEGIVLDFNAFDLNGTSAVSNLGKTAVHEVGHWLGLKHLWGDEYCGDDGIADTPKQSGNNVSCPSGVLISCGNGPNGDMYMNYMDFTNDDCINMFTLGQKARMLSLFNPGAVRNSLLTSKGLDAPIIFESPVPEEDPRWLEVKMYPNPATSELILDLAYDIRWIGKIIYIYNLHGQLIMNVSITSKIQRIDITKLQPGIYFLAAKKDDGESMKKRFTKL